jgi:hypothetical protein
MPNRNTVQTIAWIQDFTNWSAEKGGTGGRGGQSSARPPYWEGRRSARIQQRWRKHAKDKEESIQDVMPEDQWPTE